MTSLSPLQIMLIPSSFIALSGVLALTWQPSHRMRSLIQHFAFGVILADLSTDVFPEIAKEHAAAEVLIGSFALGGFFMYLMKKLTDRWERQAHASGNTGTNIGLISTTFIDAAIDGLIIGTGLAANTATGLILAVGLSVEMLFLGLSLMSETMKGKRMVLLTCVLGLVMFASMFLGYHFLKDASPTIIAAILSFGAAALVYLVTDELLIEAHTIEETPVSALWLFAGFLLFWGFELYTI